MILAFLGAGPIVAALIPLLTDDLSPLWAGFAVLVCMVGITFFLSIQIYITVTEFGLTDQRLVVKRGLLGRATAELPLVAIENVLLRQTFISRIFRYGRLQVNGSGGSPIFSPPIADPVTFRAAITEASIQMQHPEYAREAPRRQTQQRQAPTEPQRRQAQPQRQPTKPGPRPVSPRQATKPRADAKKQRPEQRLQPPKGKGSPRKLR